MTITRGMDMAKKAKKKAAKKVVHPKLTALQKVAAVSVAVEALRASVATGSKSEIDHVQATLADIAAKLSAIK